MRVIVGEGQTELRDISAIHAELTEALSRLCDADQAESAARSRATDLRNVVNRLQKQFDAAVATLQNDAPRDTDWGQKRYSQRQQVG